MTIRFNTVQRNFLADSMAGSMASATMEIRTGTQPATADTAATGTLLCTISISSHNAAASGSATLNTVTPSNGVAVATGTAGWARVITGGTGRIDGTVGTTGTDFTINNATVTTGGTVTLTACTVTQPAA